VRLLCLAALVVAAAASAADRRPKDTSILLPAATYHADLSACDRAWRAQGAKPPRYAAVINTTLCEPRQPCQYGTQVYQRVCYRRHAPAAARSSR